MSVRPLPLPRSGERADSGGVGLEVPGCRSIVQLNWRGGGSCSSGSGSSSKVVVVVLVVVVVVAAAVGVVVAAAMAVAAAVVGVVVAAAAVVAVAALLFGVLIVGDSHMSYRLVRLKDFYALEQPLWGP